MTLKFESEILFDLMKRDGDDAPSDVLPYESELKEKYLNQVVGAYPKLQDYRPEWLNYNLYHHLPSDFPTESVTNVTSASFHDVVPYAYKSAILKGSTKYRNIDTGEVFDAFEDGRNLELVSVKMPVLTTIGKNLFDKTKIIFDKLLDWDTGIIIDDLATNTTDFIKVIPNTQYTMSFNFTTFAWTRCLGLTEPKHGKYITDANGISDKCYFDTASKTITFTTSPTTNYLIFSFGKGVEESFQLEQSSTATTYEPYKSIILTVNEDVELRGIGDVQDKLDCLTGEVTESIGEIVLDGTQEMASDGYGVYIQVNDVKRFLDYTDKIACDKLPVLHSYWDLENVENGISGYTNSASYLGQNWLYVKINNSVNTDEVKEWLTQKPITVQYQRVTDSIKTVDLTCVNEQGENETFRPIEGTMHVNTSSQTLPPLLDMGVPVEATSQNLMSFANIVEEEK